jgi:hypothetical protein
MWRIYGYEMEERDPNVIRLHLHLPNQQQAYFQEGKENKALQNERYKRTMLTAYFETVYMENLISLLPHEIGYDQNGQLYPIANALTYQDFPSFYTWNTKDKQWNRRKRPHKSNSVGCMSTTSPTAGELFYLKILLTKRVGHTSFESLKSVNYIQCQSFKETCNQLGYLQHDNEWFDCLQKASHYMMPKQLRDLYVTIL